MRGIFPETKRSWSDGLPSFNQDYRNPYEIYFGLFGGEDDSGGGGDNVDRSNPNEMAAREAAAARAGTVTSTNADGTRSAVTSGGGTGVVTSGTQGQQVAAREAFNAATGNQRSNFAQDQYDQVKAREDAALQRAAAAGRLAGSDTGVDASAVNRALGRGDANEIFDFDITQNPNVTTDDLSFSTPSMALPASRSAEVSRALSAVTSPILGRPQFSQASGIPQGLIDNELVTRAAAGDNRALDLLSPEQIAAGADARFRSQVPAVGIMTTPAATAANVLGTPPPGQDPNFFNDALQAAVSASEGAYIGRVPDIFSSPPMGRASQGTASSDMARMATADAGMITDASPRSNQVVLGGGTDDMGSGVLPGGSYDRFAPNNISINDPQLGNITQTTRPDGTVDRTSDLGNVRSSTNITRTPASIAAGPVLSGATGPASDIQNLINQAAANPRQGYTPNVVNSPELRGEKAAAGTPAEDFYADVYRSRYPDVAGTMENPTGNIPGTFMAGVGNTVRNLPGIGMLLSGGPQDLPSASEQAAFKSGELLNMGGTMDEQTGAISDVPAGRGTVGMNRFGMVTYSGMPDPNYTGPYRELVNPPPEDMGGSDELKTASDPCPAGYQMVNGACQPVDDLMGPLEAYDPGSNFVINPNTGLPTLFQPTTQATQVGQVNPFALQPYTPMQAQNIQQARSGIQALSPTGAALGRAI